MKKIRKILYSFLLVFLFFGNFFNTANALLGGGPSIPSFEEIADDLEKRYGFDANILRNSKQKAHYPQANVFFSNTSPKNGEKVTATAVPSFFKNSNEDLYYTWFLFRDGEDDLEKAKQLAMGIVARGDFDPVLFGTDYGIDADDDGYDASYGGGDGRGGRGISFSGGNNGFESDHYVNPASKQIVDSNAISRCYRHNFGFSDPEDYSTSGSAGKDLIVECEHKFPRAPKGEKFANPLDLEGPKLECKDDYILGDGDFSKNEELCWQLDPTNPDTDGDGFIDEADLVGLGQTQLTWTFQEGDRLGVIIEGTSMIPIHENGGTVGDNITNQTINLDGGLSGTASTTTQESEDDNDSSSSTDFSGRISFESNENVIGVDKKADLNPYYKIMWAGTDVCDKEQVEGDDKRLLIKNDECEGTSDYGYTFLATKGISKASQDLLKTTLNFIPEEPQANKNNPEYSNYITVKANFIENDIEDGFVYYKWDIFVCTEDEIMNNTCSNEGEKLTDDCANGDMLGNCSDLESKSLIDGMGSNEIEFKGSENFYNEKVFSTSDKIYFKVFLTTKENVDSNQKYISSINIPIDKNDLGISLYNINFNDSLESSDLSDVICVNNSYQKICPVYSGQVLLAVYEGDFSRIKSSYWELDGTKILIPESDPFSSLAASSFDYYSYFPITRSGMTLSKIAFKALTNNKETVTSERILSAAEPMILKITDNNNNIWSQTFKSTTGETIESESVLWGKIGERVSVKANVVPAYLENSLSENSLELKWFLNNQEINSTFIADNPDYNFSLENQNQILNFDLSGNEGESFTLKAEIIKKFNETRSAFLKDNWSVSGIKNTNKSKLITVKKTHSESLDFVGMNENENSISLFMASTYKNAPEYFVFIIKTAIILVLFGSLFYGFNQWSSREYKLEK
jgi:hypothetical protein